MLAVYTGRFIMFSVITNIYTGRFIMFSVITNIYTGRFIMFSLITDISNKKTKGPTLMELFTATRKLEKFFLTTRDVRCVHHG